MKRPEKITRYEICEKTSNMPWVPTPDLGSVIEDVHLITERYNELVELVEVLAEKAGIKFED
jgi:hypothetical protein